MKVISLQTALKRLPKLNNEIRYRSCFEEKQFTSGLIAFRPNKSLDAKQIIHTDKDVVCHVLKGRGRLRINGRRFQTVTYINSTAAVKALSTTRLSSSASRSGVEKSPALSSAPSAPSSNNR